MLSPASGNSERYLRILIPFPLRGEVSGSPASTVGERTWAENTYRNGGSGDEAKEYRIFPYGSVLSPLNHFGRNRYREDGETMIKQFFEIQWKNVGV